MCLPLILDSCSIFKATFEVGKHQQNRIGRIFEYCSCREYSFPSPFSPLLISYKDFLIVKHQRMNQTPIRLNIFINQIFMAHGLCNFGIFKYF
jgi:hypothetical protein